MKLPSWPNDHHSNYIDLDLSRIFALLARLGNPHLKLPPAIHLAGTNGKGSTLSFLRAIFEESGLKVHSYISPHLVNFNERINLAGSEISDYFLQKILDECQAAAKKKPAISVTFFEGTTAAAFLAFSRCKADLLLLETGMGGRLDATNILPRVLCSIITPIDFDHQEFLGKTLAKIAAEKAGIIKKNCPVIIGKQKAAALRVLENKAREMSSEVKIFGRDFTKIKNSISLQGEHQLENAAVAACAALTQRKFKVTEKQISAALKKTFWPARLEKISRGKFFERLPKSCELYLDGSHNLQGATTVKKFLTNKKNRRKIIIFSMVKDKDCGGFLKKIAGKIDLLIAVEIAGFTRSRDAEEIKKIAKNCGINSTTAKNFDAAFAKIAENVKAAEGALTLVCGSLYLAGKFIEENI